MTKEKTASQTGEKDTLKDPGDNRHDIEQPDTGSAAAGQEAGSGKKPCVLIVDDNPVVLSHVSGVVRKNYDIVAVGNGSEAVETIKQDQPRNPGTGQLLDHRSQICKVGAYFQRNRYGNFLLNFVDDLEIGLLLFFRRSVEIRR